MPLTLRPYQSDIVRQTRTLMLRGARSILIQSPTGSGKTALTAHMLATAAAKGMGSWFIVHRRELVRQSLRAFSQAGINPGVVATGFFEDDRRSVQIASIQTLARRYKRVRRPRLVVWDECHHIAAGSWSTIFNALPDAFHIGLTATPERLDGQGLGEFFQEMINGPSVSRLIEDGFLSPYKMFAPSGVSLAGIHTRMGDFVASELQAAVDKPTITGDAIKHYRRHSDGKRAVVFCVSVEHSKHVVTQFQAAGIPAAHVDGETDVSERDAAIRKFEAGTIKVLSNVELFGEGFDLPAIEAAILLRPTQSLGLYLQQVGRALRPSPGKDHAVILDHAGNCERHGLPDEDREWSLEGRDTRRKGSSDAGFVRVCPKCFAAQIPGSAMCRYCAHVFEAKPRQVEQVEGDLQEIDPAIIRRERAKEQGKAQTLEQLTAIGIQRGYKHARRWAHHIFQARQAKRLAEGRTA